MQGNAAVRALNNTPGKRQTLGKGQFSLTDGTANERTMVASYQARGVPFEVREDAAARISFVTAEEFTADGTDNVETHNLSYNLVETKNTQNLVLYADGSRVQPDSIDYAGNSFDYDDGGNNEVLHAFYVARDPGSVTIEKVAPKAQASISETLTQDTTSALADRDQNKEPVTFEFTDALEGVVPANWRLNVYVDAPAPVRWDDDNLGTTNGDVATNAVVSLPIVQYEQGVPGLEDAVKRSAIGIEG
ncbi:hypothetical protein [Halorarius litoreus]|uniref:hypothetical protein n=1 Tax=Halorarius litoreus TaxID=2962676 RepID=UPI0020CCF9E3|nr:hypothetical protein [Halorarius litoreus]